MNEKKEHIKRVLASHNLSLYHDTVGYRIINQARYGNQWLSSYLKLREVYIWIEGYISERSKTT